MMKKLCYVGIIILILASGCSIQSKDTKQATKEKQTTNKKVDKKKAVKADEPIIKDNKKDGYSTWVVYWDFENAFEEIERSGDNIKKISIFQALYLEDGYELWIPSKAEKLIDEVKEKYGEDKILYLSVVNDVRDEEDNFSLKDTKLLEEILGSKEKREEHCNAMIDMALDYGLDGIELDYENVNDIKDYLDEYVLFIKLLYKKCNENGLKLRVDLEYQMAKFVNLPEGPEYVIMCYNLYGNGTGPGPKADRNFIKECSDLYVNVKNTRLALATGGFEWVNNQVNQSLTELEAKEIYEQNRRKAGKLKRDEESKYAYFSYEEDGEIHEVWYADEKTLDYLEKVANANGYYNINLWRLGGNDPDTIHMLTCE